MAASSQNPNEQRFREAYSKELQALKGDRELEEEWEKVRLQASRTPGRRGEAIKDDEISKEFMRRLIRKGLLPA